MGERGCTAAHPHGAGRLNTGPDAMTDIAARRAALFALFERLGIATTTHEHEAVFTVAESRHVKESIPGGHTKNLFLKDKKGRLFLVVALGDAVIDTLADYFPNLKEIILHRQVVTPLDIEQIRAMAGRGLPPRSGHIRRAMCRALGCSTAGTAG